MTTFHRYKELRPGQLRTFCACVRHGSYSAAARALEVSQPVVWQQVRGLERQLGARLLERFDGKLELTDVGRLFHELAGSLVVELESLLRTFEERRQRLPATLEVAGSVALFNQEMAPVVAKFCARHPEVQLSLLTYHNLEIETLLIHGELELAIIPHGAQHAGNPLLMTEVLCQRRWYLVVAADHPLAKKRRLEPADLVRFPWVLGNPQRNDWSRAVMAGLAQAGVLDDLKVSVRVDDSMTACHLAALGLGLTVSPYRPYLSADAAVRLRPIKDLFPTDQLLAVWRRGVSLRPAARRFLDFVRQAMSSVPRRGLTD